MDAVARGELPRRRYAWWASAILLLAAFNLAFRLDREMVDVWDESLFATSALEMLEHRRWAVTTFQGATDYYNSKPPLNVWLIVASFQAFGVGLVALRLPAVICAWLTVAATQWWTPPRVRRSRGAAGHAGAGDDLRLPLRPFRPHRQRRRADDAGGDPDRDCRLGRPRIAVADRLDRAAGRRGDAA